MALPLPEDRLADPALLALLAEGDLEIVGRVPASSNAAYVVRASRAGACAWAVYKPQSGERPLWDFPRGLHARERAAYLLSDALGWDVVPPTIVRADGPSGVGSLQHYIDNDPAAHYFTLQRGDAATHDALRRLALFDLVANNADRKGGHVLRGLDGRVWGIDHGLCFAAEDKLRTVIWDFADETLPPTLAADLAPLADAIPDAVASLLTLSEAQALRERVRRLLDAGRFPHDTSGRRVPWPLI